MMLKRRYESMGLEESACVILSEIIRANKSDGWCTKNEEHSSEMASILLKFNVVGNQDVNGNKTWKLK